MRIIVETELECYTALGLVHEMFKSIPGRFKDYISTPKPNLYRSLHTTVIGNSGIPFEVQIRTRQMHEEAEYGIAAHWKYKSGEKGASNIDEKLRWIAQLLVDIITAFLTRLILPMGGNTVLRFLMHLHGTNLNLERYTALTDDGSVKRTVKVRLRSGNIVFKSAGNGLKHLVNET